MLSPLREPVYAASARTLSGALAEMERVIGDALFAGYVGYNGRAPGSAAKKEDVGDSGERNKSGGDARHTLVAYFEIVELANILCVDRETSNLAIRTFRHTANNTSLRNRNVESLATAAFVSAAERRWQEYQEWLKQRNSLGNIEEPGAADPSNSDTVHASSEKWPTPPRRLSVEEISTAANLDTGEVLRYLKVVNVALRKQRPESSSSITTHMPTFCRRLELPASTRRLAIGLAEKAMQKSICSRRNPISISAAAIYLACNMEGVRKTQTEICRATTLTEVTLRKVYKELNRERSALIPDWYVEGENNRDVGGTETERLSSTYPSLKSSQEDIKQEGAVPSQHLASGQGGNARPFSKEPPIPLEPPPLPPGFGEPSSAVKELPQPQTLPTGKPKPISHAKQPISASLAGQPEPTSATPNPMLAMFNNPAMQAFANAFSRMPQLMPPPPPPLPPAGATTKQLPPGSQAGGSTEQEKRNGPSTEPSSDGRSKPQNEKILPPPGGRAASTSQAPAGLPLPPRPPFPLTPAPPTSTMPASSAQAAPAPAGNLMAGVQSMMGMMHAMQALQALQSESGAGQGFGQVTGQMNPLAMMAVAMAQAQGLNSANFGSLIPQAPVQPSVQSDTTVAGATAEAADAQGASPSQDEQNGPSGMDRDPDKNR